jgi:hypothetical protein
MRKRLNTLPHEEAEVDPRLKKRIAVELNLHQLTVKGFDYLAKKQGMKSGKEQKNDVVVSCQQGSPMAKDEQKPMTRAELLAIIEQARRENWEELDLRSKGLTKLPPEVGQLKKLDWR